MTYIAIARMENYYEGSQERNTVATEIGSTPKRSDVTGEKSRASLMIRFWCFSCGSHSSQCKLHRWLQDSRVGFAIHCKAKGRKSESVIRLPYKIFRSDHTESRNEFITGINSVIRQSICYCRTRVCTKSSGQRCNPLTIFEKRSSSVPIFVFVNRELRPSSDYDSIPVAIPATPTVIPRTGTKNSLLFHIVSWDKNSISILILLNFTRYTGLRVDFLKREERERK